MGRDAESDGVVGRIGLPAKYARYTRAHKAATAVLAALCLGLLVYSAVARNFSTVMMAFGAAIGAAVVWTMMNEVTEATRVYPERLEIVGRRGVDTQLSRQSISGFRVVVPRGEERPYIEALTVDGRQVKVLGSDKEAGAFMKDLLQPKRSAENTASLLDGWLLDGRYR